MGRSNTTIILSWRAKVNRVLPRKHTGHSKHPLLTTQETSPDSQYCNQIDYTLCSWRWKHCIQSAKTRPRTDCGSDHDLLIAKFRLKLKKVGKTMRPFRYDLNQILYEWIYSENDRFKGLDLIEKMHEELCMEFCNTIQEAMTKTISKKKKCKRAKWLSWGGLKIAEKRRDVKGKGERERYTQLNTEFQSIARIGKKAFLNEQSKEVEEDNRMGKIRDLSRKLEIPGEHFMQRWAQ